LKTLAWNLRCIRGSGLTREDFEQVLSEFKQTPQIEEIRDIVEKTDIFGNFKGTKDLCDFCEFLRTSWDRTLFNGQGVFPRR